MSIPPPKFNISTEKWWLEDYFPFGSRPIFRGKLVVKLQVGYLLCFLPISHCCNPVDFMKLSMSFWFPQNLQKKNGPNPVQTHRSVFHRGQVGNKQKSDFWGEPGGTLPKTNIFAPENRAETQKETRKYSKYPFSGANLLLVSGRVSWVSWHWKDQDLTNDGDFIYKSHPFRFSSYSSSPIFLNNWWFGARWFGIFWKGYPFHNNPFHKEIPGIQTSNPKKTRVLGQMFENITVERYRLPMGNLI